MGGAGLVNAYEVNAGVACLQCKSCVIHSPHLSASEMMHFTSGAIQMSYLYLFYLYSVRETRDH